MSNRVGNSHVVIRFKNVVLTASQVQEISKIVRPARFRKEYAAIAGGNHGWIQMSFDIGIDNSFYILKYDLSRVYDGKIYGIILYESSPRSASRIGSVAIGFPNSNCSRYVDVVRLNGLSSNRVSAEEEEIQDLAHVELLLRNDEIVHTSQFLDNGR